MDRAQHTKIIRYCAICGILFLLTLLCWWQVWQMESIRDAVEGMKAVLNDALRDQAYGWVGRTVTLAAALGAGVFALLFYLLERPLLGRRPKGAGIRESKSVFFWGMVAVLLLYLTSGNLYCMCYLHPWAYFGTAVLVFVLRLLGRTDYFPAKVS
jgi:hypothetical protein